MTFDAIPSPCFVLEESRLRDNLSILSQVRDAAGIQLILAYKGFAMWSAFPLVQEYLDGAAASSLNEVRLSNDKMGCKAHTYVVAYHPDEFEAICEGSSHITFNSLSQFEKYHTRIPSGIQVGLRINPEWSDVTTDLYNPASPASRLGMTRAELPDQLPAGIEGLHFHVLCESSAESLAEVLRHVEEKFGRWLPGMKWINMGGGHLITRRGYDRHLLIETLRAFRSRYEVEVILEPGAAIAWQAGFLRAKVLDVVRNGDVNTAIGDISFTCHMPDCLEMPYRPTIRNAHENPDGLLFAYRIGGVSCLAGDFIEAYGFVRELAPGDDLIFEDMMHYTMVKTTLFNGVRHPGIGILKTDGSFELVRQYGYDDYRDRLS